MLDNESVGNNLQNQIVHRLIEVYDKIISGDTSPELEKERISLLEKYNIIENIQTQAGSIIS